MSASAKETAILCACALFPLLVLAVAAIVILVSSGGQPSGGQRYVATAAPAWMADPTGRHQLRYWDGYRWSGYVSDQGVQSWDPLA